jgi:hypothetical protein
MGTRNKKWKWSDESRKRFSEKLKGVEKPNRRIPNLCIDCGKELSGRRRNSRCLECYRKQNHGENHSCWKGGHKSISYIIRKCRSYKKWQEQVLERDDYTCQQCDATEHIEVHHLKEMKTIIEEYNIKTLEESMECKELWDTDNGQSLCVHCHAEKHPDQRKLILKRAI